MSDKEEGPSREEDMERAAKVAILADNPNLVIGEIVSDESDDDEDGAAAPRTVTSVEGRLRARIRGQEWRQHRRELSSSRDEISEGDSDAEYPPCVIAIGEDIASAVSAEDLDTISQSIPFVIAKIAQEYKGMSAEALDKRFQEITDMLNAMKQQQMEAFSMKAPTSDTERTSSMTSSGNTLLTSSMTSSGHTLQDNSQSMASCNTTGTRHSKDPAGCCIDEITVQSDSPPPKNTARTDSTVLDYPQSLLSCNTSGTRSTKDPAGCSIDEMSVRSAPPPPTNTDVTDSTVLDYPQSLLSCNTTVTRSTNDPAGCGIDEMPVQSAPPPPTNIDITDSTVQDYPQSLLSCNTTGTRSTKDPAGCCIDETIVQSAPPPLTNTDVADRTVLDYPQSLLSCDTTGTRSTKDPAGCLIDEIDVQPPAAERFFTFFTSPSLPPSKPNPAHVQFDDGDAWIQKTLTPPTAHQTSDHQEYVHRAGGGWKPPFQPADDKGASQPFQRTLFGIADGHERKFPWWKNEQHTPAVSRELTGNQEQEPLQWVGGRLTPAATKQSLSRDESDLALHCTVPDLDNRQPPAQSTETEVASDNFKLEADTDEVVHEEANDAMHRPPSVIAIPEEDETACS